MPRGNGAIVTVSRHRGSVAELGATGAAGYSVNRPPFPCTGDELYPEAFDRIVPPLIEAFAPDVIATQLGADAYVHDPLTHLVLSTNGYAEAVERPGSGGYPWLASGGGRLRPRRRAAVRGPRHTGVMLGRTWPDELPDHVHGSTPSSRLRDDGGTAVAPEVRERARAYARERIGEIDRLIFPLHGLA